MARHYGMDWLRIGAFALLILYHIGMFFVHWDWHVKTADPVEAAAIPMLATNAWRIPLLFVVSGFASMAVFGKMKGVGAFLKDRSARLLIPLLVAMAVIIPPQPWIELVWKHGYPAPFGSFWVNDYFDFRPIEGIRVPTWQHLWFVVYLWVYTVLLGLLLALPLGAVGRAIARGAERALSGLLILLVPVALLLANLVLSWPGSDETHALVDDWGAHRVYFPLFLFGALLARAPLIWTAIQRWWPLGAAAALSGYAVVAWVEFNWPGDARPPADVLHAFGIARIFQGWGAIVALIGIADRFWNRDYPWRATLTEAVFPFYIIHQTIIVVVGWSLLRFALPPFAEFVLILAATVAGCWLFYDVGRRLNWLRPLIGLKRRVAKASEPARAASPAS